jgi:hypothetical protein
MDSHRKRLEWAYLLLSKADQKRIREVALVLELDQGSSDAPAQLSASCTNMSRSRGPKLS